MNGSHTVLEKTVIVYARGSIGFYVGLTIFCRISLVSNLSVST